MNKQETPRLLLTTNTPTTNEPALYVVGLGNGGFVIVNAVEGCGRTVLGYSDAPLPKTEAEYPDAFRYCLGEYARQIECLCQTVSSASRPSPKGYAQEVQGDVIVAPLLGATEWDQDAPYNSFCPETQDGHSPTGCMATALAQIMRYHQWPKQGPQSDYRWDLMQDNYNDGGEYSQESKDAVARLMSDVGNALKMSYGTSSSNAYNDDVPNALINVFNYDKGLMYEQRIIDNDDQSSTNDGEWWNDMLRKELDEGRPILYTGSPSGGFGHVYAGHAFVCDGYDSEGFFHFNFGWSGECNGWYVTSSISPDSEVSGATKGFSANQTAFTHIQPDCGGKQFLRAWLNGGYGNLYINFMPLFDTTVEYALCVENNQTKEITYTPTIHKEMKAFDTDNSNVRVNPDEVLKLALKDGQYTMWFVYRIAGDDEWLRPDPYRGPVKYYRDHYDVSVNTGTYTIDYPYEFSDDDFKYQFVSDDEVAIVQCFKENGDEVLTYPSSVRYSTGKSCPVVAINSSPKYTFKKVIIPSSVKNIGPSAFYNKKDLETIVFEDGSCMKEIGASAFADCVGLKQIDLPESLEYIDTWAFNGCTGLESLYVPKHVKIIGTNAFENCSAMKSLTFAADCELKVIDTESFEGCNIEGEIVFPSELRECRGSFDSPYLTSADFSNTKLRLLGITEGGNYYSEFAGCTQLKSLLLPPTLKRIGELSLPNFEAFKIPDNIEYIKSLNIPSAKYLTVPADCSLDLLTIGKQSTVVSKLKEPTSYCFTSLNSGNDIAKIYVPAGCYQAYKDYSYARGRTTYKISAEIIEMLPDTELDMGAIHGEAFIIGQSNAEGMLELPSTVVVDVYYTLNVTSIADYAFYGNNAITGVDIPASIGGVPYQTRVAGNGLEGMGEYAFAHCSGLNKVIVHWDEPLSITPTAFEGDSLSNMTLVVPKGLVGKYSTADVWKEFGNIIDESADGMENIYVDAPHDNIMYDLQGRPVKRTENGIYILNGKKILITH